MNIPDLNSVLANEQTLNTNLTAFKSELKEALDSWGIEYESTDTILDLIRLLDWMPESKAINIDGNFTYEKVWNLISNCIAMVGPASTYSKSANYGWGLIQSTEAPNYSFTPVATANFGNNVASGNATGVWVFTNEETSFKLNQNWTYECYMYPKTGKSATSVYRGLAILLGSDWADYSTYKGWCSGLSLQGSTYYAYCGVWDSAASPTLTNLSGTISGGSKYHIKMKHSVANHTIYVYVYVFSDDGSEELVSSVDLSVSTLTSDFTQEVRFGMLSRFYAYESPLLGAVYPLSNIKVE